MPTMQTRVQARRAMRPLRGLSAWLLLALALLWTTSAQAQEADLAITKDDGSSVYTPGEDVVYEIVVSNLGPDDAPDATVADPLPAGIIAGLWTCTAQGTASCGQAAGVGGISTSVDLPSGTQVTFALTMSVPAGFTGPLINTATVAAPAGVDDPEPGNNAATDENQQTIPPTVQLAKLSLGGTGTFLYLMSNLSDPDDSITTVTPGTVALSAQVSTVNDVAAPVEISEAPAPGHELESASCSDSNAGNTGNPASFGTLEGNVLTIDPDNLRSGAQIVCTFTNLASTDVSVSKSASPTAARTGEVVSYTLTVDNAGPGDASGTQLSDTPGAGLDCTTPGPTATCEASGGASCPGATVPVADLLGGGITLDALPVGGQVVVTLQCQVTAGP